MTPERLAFVLEQWRRRRRRVGQRASRAEIADYLGVDVRTLRRWLTGVTPIPRAAAVALELLHAAGVTTCADVAALLRPSTQK